MKACALPLASSCIRPHLDLTSPPLSVSNWRNQVRPPLSDAPLLHENAPSQRLKLWLHGNALRASSNQPQASPQALNGFTQTLMKCALLLLRICAPLLFSKTHKWKMSLQKYLYPFFSLLMPTLKDQWPRLDLAKSNQWVRSTPIISLRKPTFLSCFMSINSPTLWINCHFMT